MNFDEYLIVYIVGLIIGGLMAGLVLIAERYFIKKPVGQVTEKDLIVRYIAGTLALHIGYIIFLYFAEILWVWPWLFGITCIAGGIRIKTGKWDEEQKAKSINEIRGVINDDENGSDGQ